MTPQEVLEKAAESIATHGHNKGFYGNPSDGFCAMGAIGYAANAVETGAIFRHGSVTNGAITLLCEELGHFQIAQWNDRPETSAEDVMLTMKRAAHRE